MLSSSGTEDGVVVVHWEGLLEVHPGDGVTDWMKGLLGGHLKAWAVELRTATTRNKLRYAAARAILSKIKSFFSLFFQFFKKSIFSRKELAKHKRYDKKEH